MIDSQIWKGNENKVNEHKQWEWPHVDNIPLAVHQCSVPAWQWHMARAGWPPGLAACCTAMFSLWHLRPRSPRFRHQPEPAPATDCRRSAACTAPTTEQPQQSCRGHCRGPRSHQPAASQAEVLSIGRQWTLQGKVLVGRCLGRSELPNVKSSNSDNINYNNTKILSVEWMSKIPPNTHVKCWIFITQLWGQYNIMLVKRRLFPILYSL